MIHYSCLLSDMTVYNMKKFDMYTKSGVGCAFKNSLMKNQRRIYTRRIDQVDLNNQTTQILQECGTDNHVQALFYSNLAQAVNSTPKSQLVPLKCHIKDKSRESWAIAFQIVIEFLESQKMKLTFDTMNFEDKKPLKYKSNIASRLHLSSRYSLIGELIRSTASYRKLPLKQRLLAQSGEETRAPIHKRSLRK
ncbi:hypothetical protein TRFO_14622 [Tritrichomonas foetus]|uniref:Uncharacterized protein n=1 Tax=Tritrichomonas foetus TaxID=1144522 RepID=A0A1J4KUK5_9EUKA|nr:hypothetical protein TRFO_14622 [Tritrichomonas foetus]|eukprot:OHT14961.1 hypothetical protein TRFO_14622 [Tritrichomonas foetus]